MALFFKRSFLILISNSDPIKMSFEIEHKYIVINNGYLPLASAAYQIIQGYLSRDPSRTVRVRLKGEKAFITIKGITNGDTRREYEYEIPTEDAKELLSICEPPLISKTRFIVPYGNLVWEIDRFDNRTPPLTIAEVELDYSRHDYEIPPFVGKEVTGDPAYYNSNL